jgi:hypothetical protein
MPREPGGGSHSLAAKFLFGAVLLGGVMLIMTLGEVSQDTRPSLRRPSWWQWASAAPSPSPGPLHSVDRDAWQQLRRWVFSAALEEGMPDPVTVTGLCAPGALLYPSQKAGLAVLAASVKSPLPPTLRVVLTPFGRLLRAAELATLSRELRKTVEFRSRVTELSPWTPWTAAVDARQELGASAAAPGNERRTVRKPWALLPQSDVDALSDKVVLLDLVLPVAGSASVPRKARGIPTWDAGVLFEMRLKGVAESVVKLSLCSRLAREGSGMGIGVCGTASESRKIRVASKRIGAVAEDDGPLALSWARHHAQFASHVWVWSLGSGAVQQALELERATAAGRGLNVSVAPENHRREGAGRGPFVPLRVSVEPEMASFSIQEVVAVYDAPFLPEALISSCALTHAAQTEWIFGLKHSERLVCSSSDESGAVSGHVGGFRIGGDLQAVQLLPEAHRLLSRLKADAQIPSIVAEAIPVACDGCELLGRHASLARGGSKGDPEEFLWFAAADRLRKGTVGSIPSEVQCRILVRSLDFDSLFVA